MNKHNLDYYSKPAKLKYPWWGKYIDRITRNYSRIQAVSMLNCEGLSCLDVACGDGVLLNKYLYKRYSKVEGVDVSTRLIKKARCQAKSNCKFIVSEVETYVDKVIKNRFKYSDVYLLAVLEHLMWPSILIDRITKIIEDKGRIIVEVPNVAWLPYRINMFFGRFPETAPTNDVIPGVYDEHIRFYTLETLDLMFNKIGYTRSSLTCSGRLRKIKMICPKLFASDFIAVYRKK